MTIYTDKSYYVYAYLREDQTPYYIGKGIDRRAYQAHKRKNGSDMLPDDTSRIKLLHENLSEKQAFDLEKELIVKYGRKDLGTGILRNLTEGGEGNRRTGWNHSEEAKLAMSKAKIGKPSHRKGVPSPMKGVARSEETKKKISEANKGRVIGCNKKKSIAALNRPVAICPHCGVKGKRGGVMTRWHFDNCRSLRSEPLS